MRLEALPVKVLQESWCTVVRFILSCSLYPHCSSEGFATGKFPYENLNISDFPDFKISRFNKDFKISSRTHQRFWRISDFRFRRTFLDFSQDLNQRTCATHPMQLFLCTTSTMYVLWSMQLYHVWHYMYEY